MWKCEKCAAENMDASNECVFCGAGPAGPEIHPENKKCPYCAESILWDAVVCKHCGRDLQHPVIRQPGFHGARIMVLVSGVGLMIGALLPFATATTAFGTLSKAGIEGDGIFTFGIGLILALVSLIYKGRPGRAYSVWMGLLALAAGGILIMGVLPVAVEELIEVGSGAYISLLAAPIGVFGGLVSTPK